METTSRPALLYLPWESAFSEEQTLRPNLILRYSTMRSQMYLTPSLLSSAMSWLRRRSTLDLSDFPLGASGTVNCCSAPGNPFEPVELDEFLFRSVLKCLFVLLNDGEGFFSLQVVLGELFAVAEKVLGLRMGHI